MASEIRGSKGAALEFEQHVLGQDKVRQTSDSFRGVVGTLSYGKQGVWKMNKTLEDL